MAAEDDLKRHAVTCVMIILLPEDEDNGREKSATRQLRLLKRKEKGASTNVINSDMFSSTSQRFGF